ncbi:MAG: hypothetical protein EBS23_10385, partial [Betaproteobacteria bacterium]|nr:hypothetical protein [Betaproteobacteria bacterium]
QEGGTVLLSRATGSVTGSSNVGGFVGYGSSSGTIDRSYATGAVVATGSGAGGFAGYLDSGYSGTIKNSFAMGAVVGNSNVGGFVGYADRGTLQTSYSTGHVALNSGSTATSIGGFVGSLNTTSGATLPTFTNVYFDSTTSGRTADGLGTTTTVRGVALTTTQLQGAATTPALPNGFSSATFTPTGASNTLGIWATGSGLYPYLRELFGGPLTLTTVNNVTTGAYNQTPQAISGTASLATNAAAVGAQVGVYAGGKLLGGGTVSTGANGYYYTLVGTSMSTPLASSQLSIGASTGIGASLRLAGASDDAGGRYTDLPLLTGNNLTAFDLAEGLNRARTSATSLTALGARVDAV